MPDGHNAPRLIYEFVPRLAAEVDDIVVGSEHPVGEPVVAHELPDILNRVEFRTFGRERDDADIVRHIQLVVREQCVFARSGKVKFPSLQVRRFRPLRVAIGTR